MKVGVRIKIGIHNTDNAKELFRIIYILSENVIKDFIINNILQITEM